VEPKLQLQLVIRRVSLQTGVQWIKDAWQVFKRAPSVLIGMTAFMTMVGLVAQMHPLLLIALLLANPFLSAGFYRTIVQLQKAQPVQFADLFAVFKQAQYRRIFVRLASANVIASIPLSLLSGHLVTQFEQGHVELWLMLSLVAAAFLVFMLFAYAVAISYFLNEQRLQVILNASLTACWRNVGALTVYGLLSVALACLGLMSFMLGFIVIIPLLQVAFFLSFSSIFALQVGPNQEQSTLEV